MAEIETKIEKLIATSLFLDNTRKEKLRKVVKKATPEEKERLVKVLESEKTEISGIVQNYIKNNGKEAVANLNRTIKKGKLKLRKTKEVKENKKEEAEMEDLLDRLDKT
ncbi:MAG: hypothetical protein ABH856_04320 [Patescibacteria group bacterium]|nr:hypothetical protein [Patescibacteria group bacterium]